MKATIKKLISTTAESRQSKDMFRAGRDAEIVNRANYGFSNYNITYSNATMSPSVIGTNGYYQGATVMLDGRVFCAGGYSGIVSVVYDPVNDTLTNCIEANPTNKSYPAIGTVLLRDGRIFISPYYTFNGSSAQGRIYDPSTNIITNLPRLYNNSYYYNAIALFDSRIYISPFSPNVLAIVLDIDKDQILTLPMTFPSGCNGSGVLLDGRVCSPKYGTNFMYIWDPVTNTYDTVSLPPGSEFLNTMCLLSDGRLFITDGYVNSKTFNIIFDPATRTCFQTSTPPNSQDYFSTCTLTTDGKIAMIGNTSIVIYDPITDSYASVPPFQTGVFYTSNTVLPDGRMIVIPSYSTNPVSTVKIAFIGDKLPITLPNARTCSPVYNLY